MIRTFARVSIAGLALALLQIAAAGADPAPAPKVTPTPNPFSYSGQVRAYYFTRQNASAYPKGTGQLNQTSFNTSLKLHGEYVFARNLTAGATYVLVNPLGANGPCNNTANYGPGGGCQQYPTSNNTFKMSDTTLPGYAMNALAEAWLQYKDKLWYAKVGTQLLNTPWAGPSDSRLKPSFFEGADVKYAIAPGWSLGLARMIQWQARNQSDFNKSTLLTIKSDGTIAPVTGFLLGTLTYKHGSTFTGALNYYQFYDIANLLWLEGRWTDPHSPMKPYFGLQLANESSNGKALVGMIDNQTIGAQIGASLGRNVDVAISYDHIPWKSKDVSAASCGAAQSASGLFLPTGGTPICQTLPSGLFRIFYGGIASPYSDSFATDPLYTGEFSQTMVDRRSAGDSYKIAATFQPNDKRFKAILSRTIFNYGNGAGSEKTYENNIDVTWFFNKVPSNGPYRGLSLRHRYAERTLSNTVLFGGLPLFKYNRTQLQFDF
jgi:outer membrane OprD family porin